MAVPSYTTDLTTISTGDSGTFIESTATGWTLGAAPGSGDAENFIQGLASVTKAFNATGVGTIMFNNGAGVTIPTDGAFLAWFFWASPQTLDTEANGGIRLIIGSAQNAHYAWTMAGKDSYPYGGWVNYAADPAVTPDYTAGAPTATRQFFGVAANNLNAITKGNPMAMDAIRYGRCEARMNGGETANYATFSGYATTNDTTTNRWGLIQELNGAYQIKGLVIFGYTSAVDFRDSNKSIFIQNTKKVTSGFNAFEVRQSTSRVDLTSISITALGTVSRGNWITTDNATINITSCTFTDMGTFGFQAASTIIDTVFRRTNLITQNTAVFTSCTIDSTNDATRAMLVNDPSKITSTQFTSSGTKHAIELSSATAGSSYNFSGNLFTGYAATDGSTGNEAIYNNSGGAVTLSITNGGTYPISVRNGAGASTTISSSITITVTLLDQSGSPIPGVEVAIFRDNAARTLVLTSTPTNGSGAVVTAAAAGLGAIIIRARQSAKSASFLTSIAGIDAAGEVVTTLTTHNFRDGDAVVYSKDGGSVNIGLTDATTYYVNALTTTTLSLHTTAALAIADSSRINLSISGAETHLLDPVRYIPSSATGTIGGGDFSAQITMITDTIATG